MSYSKEDFSLMVEHMKARREYLAEMQKLEEEKRKKEQIKREKKLEKEINKRTEYLLKKYYDTIIKKTLESFMSSLEKVSFPHIKFLILWNKMLFMVIKKHHFLKKR